MRRGAVMAKLKAVDPEVRRLAEGMAEALERLRTAEEGEGYPSTVGRLGELVGIGPDRAVEVAATAKALPVDVVVKKVDRKVVAESVVHWKAHPPGKRKPAKPDPSELVRRMGSVLAVQRRLGHPAYPLKVRRLVELCDFKASDPLVTKALKDEALSLLSVVAGQGGSALDHLILLKSDAEGLAAVVMPGLLEHSLEAEAAAAGKAPSKGKAAPGPTHLFGAKALAKHVGKGLSGAFVARLAAGLEEEALPEGVGYLLLKGEPQFFRLSEVRSGRPTGTGSVRGGAVVAPVGRSDEVERYGVDSGRESVPFPSPSPAPRPSADFAGAFRAAFDRLDRQHRSGNSVKLSELRRELSGFDREAFDSGLRQLRRAEEFSLESHEGLIGTLTVEDREAAVRESGSVLIYASRRLD